MSHNCNLCNEHKLFHFVLHHFHDIEYKACEGNAFLEFFQYDHFYLLFLILHYKLKHVHKKECLNCGLELIKKYRGETHCSMLCKSEYIMKNTTIEESSKRTDGAKYGNIRSAARSYSKYFLDPKCYKCGYDKHFEVCHIKDISSFPKDAKIFEVNQISNLVHLCPNCHWEFDNLCSNKHLFLPK